MMREKKVHKLEVHVAGLCFREGTVFTLKRAQTRRLYPGLWECGGGQVWTGENFDEAIVRQFEEETGMIVKTVQPFKTYEIVTLDEQKKIPGLRFLCTLDHYSNGKGPVISEEHTEYRWQPVDCLGELEFIPGLEEAIQEGYALYRNL